MNIYVKEAMEILKKGETLPTPLVNRILQLKKDNLNWELFDLLFNNPNEKATGYWITAKVALELMQPKISAVSQKMCDRLRYNDYYDDFNSNLLFVFREQLEQYDPSKSKFPHFISRPILHEMLTFDKDASYYQIKTKDIRIYSLDGLVNDSQDSVEHSSYPSNQERISLEQQVENSERNALFDNIFDLCGIEVNHNEIETDLKQDKQSAINFVIALKFLGDIDSPNKVNVFNRVMKETYDDFILE